MQHELVSDPWIPVDGLLSLRAGAGLGVDVHEKVVHEYEFSG
jgi:L-alanine-DL-glutamate epimerase-like enolase superfamily enzyme